MVIVIMAAIGILLVGLGLGVGVLFLLPAIIAIIIKIVKAIYEKAKYEERVAEAAAQEREKERAEEEQKQQAIEKQKQLIGRYKNNPLTKEVMHVIRGGNPLTCMPEKILIYNDCIQGNVRGKTFTYDFSANRVHSFSTVIRTVERKEELKYVVRPQIAMAEALNSLFGNNYEIYDNAREDFNYHTDIDGDSYTTITYMSNHVVMVLRSTLPNKQF